MPSGSNLLTASAASKPQATDGRRIACAFEIEHGERGPATRDATTRTSSNRDYPESRSRRSLRADQPDDSQTFSIL